jgi:uncharacterized protein YciI
MPEKHYLLFYQFALDYLERRPALRPAHLKHTQEFIARGELLLGGAFVDPADGGALLFKTPTREVVEAFARADPYVTAGLVTSWRVREWATVVGPEALTPLPSSS